MRFSITTIAVFALWLFANAASAQPAKESGKMTQPQASAFAKLALKGIRKEYPNKPGHVLNERRRRQDAQGAAPRVLRLLRLALVGAWPLDAGAAAASLPRPAREATDPRRAGGASDREEPPGRGRLLQAAESAIVRADLRLGLAAEAGRGAARLGRPRREDVVEEPEAAGGHDRRPLPRVLPEADVPDPQRRASEHGVRPGVRPRLCAGCRSQARCAS